MPEALANHSQAAIPTGQRAVDVLAHRRCMAQAGWIAHRANHKLRLAAFEPLGLKMMHSLPIPASIVGESLELRPLHADDFASLYHVASDPLIWVQHPSPLRYQEPVFREWFNDALAAESTLVVIDRSNNKLIGSSRYYEFDAAKRQVAIGYTFLAREKWGGGTNKELKHLMLTHAFQQVDTVWFHIDSQNIRSQRAMEKIGAHLSHRATRQLADRIQEYLLYKIESTACSD